jgi:glycosyltransferase involved in cell wall biosynthesis
MPPNPRTRVLFVIGSMGGGGAERQVLEILKRIDRARFEPNLYLAMKQGELLEQVPFDVPIYAYWDGSPETRTRRILGLLKLTRLLRYLDLARVLREQQIDVVYDRTYLATLDAAGGCWFRPTPRISCCVADPGPELELYVRGSVALSRWIARRAYLSADIVLANSEGLRQRVIEYFQLKPDHVTVYNNLLSGATDADSDAKLDEKSDGLAKTEDGVSQGDSVGFVNRLDSFTQCSTSFGAEDQSLRAIFEAKETPFLIVSAGRLHPQKGYMFLLEAMNELIHRRGRLVRLVIFGKGESEEELREFVRIHHLERHVFLAGFVANPRQWYHKANLFVLPSLFDAMPNALIEAAASRVPALATTCPSGPKEILDGGRCGGLVPPADSKALADAITDAMDHPEKWLAKAILARERVIQMFDPEAGIRRLENLLEQIAGKSSISNATLVKVK